MIRLFLIIIIIFIIIFITFPFLVLGEEISPSSVVEINFFYSAVCHHCEDEKEFLKDLEERYPEIRIKSYEVLSKELNPNQENIETLKNFYEKYQVSEKERGRVPVTFTPTKYFVGFNEQIGEEIESCIKECFIGTTSTPQRIKAPFFGEIDLSKMSLPILTIVLGAMDGLNPCAMWVLLFLIILLINVRSRKRMILIGGTFILASGIIYFLILSAWLNLFLAISYVNLTRIIIGIFAIAVGIWQIRNFIKFRPGVCKITDGGGGLSDKIKNGLKNQAEKLAFSPLTFGIVGGLIILALGVNLVEFFCSAGLPATFTRILTLNQLSKLSYYLYLLLYTFIFMLDDLIIFSLAAITLSRIGFTEKYNYWATLIGGLLILILGILLIFKPEILMFG